MRTRKCLSFLCTMLVLSVMAAVSSAQTDALPPSILQAAGFPLEPVGASELLAAIRLEGTDTTNWYLLGPAGHARLLGSNFSQLPDVRKFALAPGGRNWLAVQSEAAGHTLVELIDLRQLVSQRRYVVLQQINPSPGFIHIVGWQGARLIVRSNAPLARHASAGSVAASAKLLAPPRNFVVTVNTGRIEEYRPRPVQRTGSQH